MPSLITGLRGPRGLMRGSNKRVNSAPGQIVVFITKTVRFLKFFCLYKIFSCLAESCSTTIICLLSVDVFSACAFMGLR